MRTRLGKRQLAGWILSGLTLLASARADEPLRTILAPTTEQEWTTPVVLASGERPGDDALAEGTPLAGTVARAGNEVYLPPLPDEGGEGAWVTLPEGDEVPLEPPPTYAPYVPHLGGPYTGIIPYAEPVQYDPCVHDREDPFLLHMLERVTHFIEKPLHPMADFFGEVLCEEHDETPLNLDFCPIGIQRIPCRPPLAIEWGERFLAPGQLRKGCYTETCEVVRPAFWVWGEYRGHYAYRDNQPGTVNEWANRLDLFGQLNLSGTERLVVGLRPLDKQAGNGSVRQFAGYDFFDGDWNPGGNINVQTLFFEGDFGEIFPYISPYDFEPTDIGFSVGRQPLLAQQGLLINEDQVDMVSITRNTLNGNGNLNLRATAFYSWAEINRDTTNPAVQGNFQDNTASMYGLLTESDFEWATVNADAVYLDADDPNGRMWAYGITAIQRIHLLHTTFNNSFSFLVSDPVGPETIHAGQGELLFNQLSWTPHETDDVVYVNGFWGIDQFTSPARGPLMGGPVGQVGILFAHAGLGNYGPVLSNRLNDTVGTAIGYQMFYDETRQNVTVEVGGRADTDGFNKAAAGFTTRYQRAMGQHWIWTLEGFVAKQEANAPATGGRTEILFRF